MYRQAGTIKGWLRRAFSINVVKTQAEAVWRQRPHRNKESEEALERGDDGAR
jgi:hypothetical protein